MQLSPLVALWARDVGRTAYPVILLSRTFSLVYEFEEWLKYLLANVWLLCLGCSFPWLNDFTVTLLPHILALLLYWSVWTYACTEYDPRIGAIWEKTTRDTVNRRGYAWRMMRIIGTSRSNMLVYRYYTTVICSWEVKLVRYGSSRRKTVHTIFITRNVVNNIANGNRDFIPSCRSDRKHRYFNQNSINRELRGSILNQLSAYTLGYGNPGRFPILTPLFFLFFCR